MSSYHIISLQKNRFLGEEEAGAMVRDKYIFDRMLTVGETPTVHYKYSYCSSHLLISVKILFYLSLHDISFFPYFYDLLKKF
jgi:hypothetical protein